MTIDPKSNTKKKATTSTEALLPYEVPTITRLGTVLELTQLNKNGPNAEFPQGGSGG